MALLRITDGHHQGLVRELGQSPITIGRDAANHIQIADPKASRVHVRITWNGNGHDVTDCGSSNGTWNDSGKIGKLTLKPGAEFRIGNTYFRYEQSGSGSGSHTIAEQDHEWRAPTRLESLPPTANLLAHTQAEPARATQANRFLLVLLDVVRRAMAAKNRDALFDILDDIAAEALDGDRCAVFLPGEERFALWPAHRRRLQARFGATPFAQTLLETAWRRPEPLLCSYLGGDLPPSASMVQAGVRAAMCAPLRLGKEVLALIYVDRLEGEEPFAETDLEFLAAVANQLAVRLANMDREAALSAEVERLQQEKQSVPPPEFIGSSPACQRLRDFLSRAAQAHSPMLLYGESGTGKDLCAHIVHRCSPRAAQPMPVANCAALGQQVEIALFGAAKGAAPGLEEQRPGLFELADGGTLYLNEVGDLPASAQARLLRLLEHGELTRLGDNALRHIDVRLICSSQHDLHVAVQAGQFRGDLLHRLDVLSCTLPPLRERPEDIEPLIDHVLGQACARLEKPRKTLSTKVRAVLLGHTWPGNVRQLRNCLERAVVLSAGETIELCDLPEYLTMSGSGTRTVTPITTLGEIERNHILRVLNHCSGNKKATAEILGIDRSTLYAKLRQYGKA